MEAELSSYDPFVLEHSSSAEELPAALLSGAAEAQHSTLHSGGESAPQNAESERAASAEVALEKRKEQQHALSVAYPFPPASLGTSPSPTPLPPLDGPSAQDAAEKEAAPTNAAEEAGIDGSAEASAEQQVTTPQGMGGEAVGQQGEHAEAAMQQQTPLQRVDPLDGSSVVEAAAAAPGQIEMRVSSSPEMGAASLFLGVPRASSQDDVDAVEMLDVPGNEPQHYVRVADEPLSAMAVDEALGGVSGEGDGFGMGGEEIVMDETSFYPLFDDRVEVEMLQYGDLEWSTQKHRLRSVIRAMQRFIEKAVARGGTDDDGDAYVPNISQHWQQRAELVMQAKEVLFILVNKYMSSPGVLSEILEMQDAFGTALNGLKPLLAPQLWRSEQMEQERLRASAANQNRAQSDDEGAAAEAMAAAAISEEEDPYDHARDPTNTEEFECAICFDDVEPGEGYVFDHEAGCRYCLECLRDYYGALIGENNVAKIPCPNAGACDRVVHYYDVKRVLPEAAFTKYDSFVTLGFLQQDPNLKFCPNPKGCGNAVINEPGNRRVVCPDCEWEYCADCLQPHHLGTCESYLKWREENGMVDTKFQEFVKENTKPCPQCKAPIQKISGCNHMTCTAPGCKYQFCWLCGGKYTANHYSPVNLLGCPGMQFSSEAQNIPAGVRTARRRAKKFGIGCAVVLGGLIALPLVPVAAVLASPVVAGYFFHRWRRNR